MDWAGAIERNSEALTGILTALFAMLGLASGATLGRIPRDLHRAVLRVLRPAESAVRRLIIIAARGLVAKPVAPRPSRQGHVIATGKSSTKSATFQLYDTRKRFDRRPRRATGPGPRIISIWPDPHLVPLFQTAWPPAPPAPPPDDGLIDASRLSRRLEAMKLALADLPGQANRLVRWQARRQALQKRRPVFTSPMRPGRPPGYRKKPTHEVDEVLAECHRLARDAERPDTS